jgi:hypothetical protein
MYDMEIGQHIYETYLWCEIAVSRLQGAEIVSKEETNMLG